MPGTAPGCSTKPANPGLHPVLNRVNHNTGLNPGLASEIAFSHPEMHFCVFLTKPRLSTELMLSNNSGRNRGLNPGLYPGLYPELCPKRDKTKNSPC